MAYSNQRCLGAGYYSDESHKRKKKNKKNPQMLDQKVPKISHVTYRLLFLSKERRDLTLAETHVPEQTSVLVQC